MIVENQLNHLIRRYYKDDQWDKKQKFCCKDCASISSRNRKNIKCCWCDKEFERQVSDIKKYNFCSRKCKDKAQSLGGGMVEIQPNHYGNGCGIKTYRSVALNYYPNKCHVCGYDKFVGALDVHHIDGDRSNNELENLIILCPTCHATITRKIAYLNEDRDYLLLR